MSEGTRPAPRIADQQVVAALITRWRDLAERGLSGATRGQVNRCIAIQGCADELEAALSESAEALQAQIVTLTTQLAEQRAELTGTLSEAFQAIPACYDTPADHYREMARRLVEDRDVQKHKARAAEARVSALRHALEKIVGFAAGWDADGATGVIGPLSWRAVALESMDTARRALLTAPRPDDQEPTV